MSKYQVQAVAKNQEIKLDVDNGLFTRKAPRDGFGIFNKKGQLTTAKLYGGGGYPNIFQTAETAQTYITNGWVKVKK